LRFDTPLRQLKRVGPSVAEKLARLNLNTVQDLLFHLPLRYQDRTKVVAIGGLRQGDEALIEAEVLLTDVKYARRRMLLSKVTDETGILMLRFFHFNSSQQQALKPGVRIRCFGEVRNSALGLEMVHPEYQILSASMSDSPPDCLTAFYPTTEGLGQYTLRSLIDQLIRDDRSVSFDVPEWLPEAVLRQFNFPPLQQALANLHKPPPGANIEVLKSGQHPYQQRLAFEELLAHQLSMRKRRLLYQQNRAPAFIQQGNLTKTFQDNLPFVLTAAQQRVCAEIFNDQSSAKPMLRLVQGDVGSGKTVVAALAVVHAIESGYQAAIMAPTELLAYQHYRNFCQWLQPFGIQVHWLAGTLKGGERNTILANMQNGEAKIIVGTHALFQEDVAFAKLGLVVIDEQHRFGVHQRLALRNKGKTVAQNSEIFPHQLIMTATPIPRTLAMTEYADLDYSVIDELPPGRTPVQTIVLQDTRRQEIIERVYQACKTGRQAYWVCTLIEESEILQCQAAEETASRLHEELPEINIGLIHGRMKSAEKDKLMQLFKRGEIHLLVSTTVIEVGVDVANATLMIIENAERLGLAQLHQLRGRVGRSEMQSVCVLMYHGSLSQTAKKRLKVMRDSNDGFEIAQRDLEIRGPGELMGTRQTGMAQFHIADIQRDQALLPKVIRTSNLMLAEFPHQSQCIIERWWGQNAQYSNV